MKPKTKKEKIECLQKALEMNKHNKETAEANIEELEAYLPILKNL